MAFRIGRATIAIALVFSGEALAQSAAWGENASTSVPEPAFKLDSRLFQDQIAPFVCTQTPRSIDPGANDCPIDPLGNSEACCYFYEPSSGKVEGPACVQWARNIQFFRQVGKGYCCDSFPAGNPFMRFEDLSKPCEFCGGKTPKLDECCTIDYDIIKAYPVKDRTVCRNLRQDTDHPEKKNGCGPEPLAKKGIHFPDGYGPVNFLDACDAHDYCYTRCGSRKADCDRAFLIALTPRCDAYYGPLIDDAGTTEEANELEFERGKCNWRAGAYYSGVTDQLPLGVGSLELAEAAFEEGQQYACRCCVGGSDVPF